MSADDEERTETSHKMTMTFPLRNQYNPHQLRVLIKRAPPTTGGENGVWGNKFEGGGSHPNPDTAL